MIPPFPPIDHAWRSGVAWGYGEAGLTLLVAGLILHDGGIFVAGATFAVIAAIRAIIAGRKYPYLDAPPPSSPLRDDRDMDN